jgi:hypothetical protein
MGRFFLLIIFLVSLAGGVKDGATWLFYVLCGVCILGVLFWPEHCK